MTTWRKLINEAMALRGESLETTPHEIALGEVEIWDWEDRVTVPGDLDREFYDGYGSSNGGPFTLWTENYVYFPVVYDGAEWVDSVPRNPNGEATDHVGGQ